MKNLSLKRELLYWTLVQHDGVADTTAEPHCP